MFPRLYVSALRKMSKLNQTSLGAIVNNQYISKILAELDWSEQSQIQEH